MRLRLATLAALLLVAGPSAHAAVLKGVLSGSLTMAAGSANASQALSAVDTTKSFLVFGVAEAEDAPQFGQVVGRISNPTTVAFTRNSSPSGAITIKWYVAEFSS